MVKTYNLKCMKPDEINLADWQRILVGDVPPEFYLELVIRTLFLFALLIISLRLLGRRMSAKTSRIELTALFTLAAAIGVPLQAPDRGLLPAIVIAIVVILVGRMVAAKAFKSQSFEQKVVDDFSILVKDGVIQMHEMEKTRVTVERLFAQLRGYGIYQLGEIRRLYFEANGSFTLVRHPAPFAGLTVIPAVDRAFLDERAQAAEKVCRSCGSREHNTSRNGTCSNCGDKEWVSAIQ
jgi:uncharacterized membrane protein YcaP (DUF421 family)